MSGSATGTVGINGGLDTSIPLQAGRGVPQTNPLESIGRFANAAQGLNALKLFPGQLQLQQQAIQGGATSLAQQQYRAAAGALIPLLAKKPGTITVDDVATGLGSAEKHLGIITQPFLQDLTANAPPPNSPDYDQYIRSRVAAMSQGSPETAVGQVTYHNGPTFDDGQNLIPTKVAGAGLPNPGVPVPAGQPIPTYPSRSQLIGQVTWKDASGVDHYGTNAEYAAARGLDSMIGPATPVQGAPPAAPSAQPPISGGGVVGTGGVPVSPQNPPRLAPTSKPSNTAGPEPGTAEYKALSAGNANTANARAASFQSDMFPLLKAQEELAIAPTGKGSEAAHNVSSYLNTFAPSLLQKGLALISPIMTPDQVAAYDEAKKYLTQVTLGGPGATRSNEGLSTAGAASPSTVLSKEAAQVVLRGMIGLRRMEQESVLEFNKSGLPPAAYNSFQTEFTTRADPRVYMFDQLAPAARAKLVNGMSPAQRTKFWDQVHVATQNGILTPPQAPNGQ